MKKKIKSIIGVIVSVAAVMTFLCVDGNKTIMASEADITSDLVAKWTFDDNYTESVSNIPTKLGGKQITYDQGIHGKAAVFNGIDQYLEATQCSQLDLNSTYIQNKDNFTISMWLNIEDSRDVEKFILDKGNSGWIGDDYYTRPYRVYLDGSGLGVELNNGYNNGKTDYLTEGSAYIDEAYADGCEWFLYTVTYDGSRLKTYRNNVLAQQTNYTYGMSKNDMNLFIGVDSEFSKFFKGKIDDLRMYTRTFTYDDVDMLYNEGIKANKEALQPTKQLVGYYKFDGNLEDSSKFKLNGIEVTTKGTKNYGPGKSGKSLTIKNGRYFEIPYGDNYNLGNEYTISLWVKSELSESRPLLFKENPAYGGDNDNEYSYSLYSDTWGNNEICSFTMKSNIWELNQWQPSTVITSEVESNYSTTGIYSNEWKHVAFTFSNGTVTSYLNGKVQSTKDNLGLTKLVNGAGSLLIGYDGNTFFQGSLDELKIYNKCLTPTQVKNEYKRVNSVSIDQNTINKLAKMKTGFSITIPQITFKDINTLTKTVAKSSDAGVTFTSSNPKIISVGNNGVVKALKSGTAYVTVTYNDISKSIKVNAKSDTLYLNESDIKLISKIKVGKSASLGTIKVKDGYTGNYSTIKTSSSKVTFKSSNTNVFTVNNYGKLKGVKNGIAKLTICYNGYEKKYTISVKSDTISLGTTITNKLSNIKVSSPYNIESIKVKDGITGKTSTILSKSYKVKFKSSNTKLFTVNNFGKITGIKAGTGKLIITYDGFAKEYTVKIK